MRLVLVSWLHKLAPQIQRNPTAPIIDQIGVSLVTVNKMRNTSGERRCSPEKRAGRDGKSYPSSRAGANPNVKVEPRSADLSQGA